MIKIKLPIKTVSEANRREHWATKAKRVKKQREAVRMIMRPLIEERHIFDDEEIDIELIRHGKRKLDCDNLAGSFKAIRDGIADALGIDDGSERLAWYYDQEKSKDYSIEIKISI